jgi:hypothetical protein
VLWLEFKTGGAQGSTTAEESLTSVAWHADLIERCRSEQRTWAQCVTLGARRLTSGAPLTGGVRWQQGMGLMCRTRDRGKVAREWAGWLAGPDWQRESGVDKWAS